MYELCRVSDAAKHWAPPFFCHLPTQVTIKDTCFLLAWPFYEASVPGIGHRSLWGAGPPCPWSTIPVLGRTVCPVHSEGAKRCLSDLSRSPSIEPPSSSPVLPLEFLEVKTKNSCKLCQFSVLPKTLLRKQTENPETCLNGNKTTRKTLGEKPINTSKSYPQIYKMWYSHNMECYSAVIRIKHTQNG